MKPHKRILLWLDRDCEKPFDYAADRIENVGGNSGNMAFEYALQRMLKIPGNKVEVCPAALRQLPDIDRINREFDCLVFAPANLLALWARDGLLEQSRNWIRKMTIPVYAIGLGAASDIDYSMDFLPLIEPQARAFVDAILASGGGQGKLGVRGRFTAACLRALGYREDSDFFVIGCPSFFVNGIAYQVVKNKVSRDEFAPLLNGFRFWNHREYRDQVMQQYPRALFVRKNFIISCIEQKALPKRKGIIWPSPRMCSCL